MGPLLNPMRMNLSKPRPQKNFINEKELKAFQAKSNLFWMSFVNWKQWMKPI
jgi:hypothetical protein